MLRKRMWQPTALAPEGPVRPQEAVTLSRCGVVSSQTTAHVERTTSKVRECFYPRERCTVAPANTLQVVRRTVATAICAHNSEDTALQMQCSAQA
jgi:hypothetical protein